MTTPKVNKIPGPLYAAAGAGDLAYEKLRTLPQTLPGKVAQLRGRVVELRPIVTEAAWRPDIDRLRGVARRNATTIMNGAHAAGDRAAAVYSDLVARGERVVETARAERGGKAGPGPVATPEVTADTAVPVAELTPPAEPVTAKLPTEPSATEEPPTAKLVEPVDKPVETGSGDPGEAKPAAKRGRPAAK